MAKPKAPKKKRSNGDGGVWQLPTGLWRWELVLGYVRKPDGSRSRKTKSGTAKNETEAKKALTLARADKERGILATPDRITVAEWLGKWLADKRTSISANTHTRYGQLIQQNIVPYLGDTKLQALKPLDIRAWHTALLERGLSAKTIRSAHTLLNGAMRKAVALELVMRNLADVVRPELPKQDNSIKPSQVWTPQEASAFLAVARGHSLYALFYLMLSLGLRRGEACGLRWQHIDLEHGLLRVEEALVTIGSTLAVNSTKTKHSARTLQLPHEAIEVLRLHKAAQNQRHLEYGVLPAKDWLFTSQTGTVFRPDNVMRTFEALCKTAEVRRVRLHDLRHTYVSLAARAGVPLATVSRQAGHARASFTGDEYRHVFPDEMQQAVLNLSELLTAKPKRLS
jgi:integrase